MRLPLGVWVYIPRDYINTATGRIACISIITIFRQPLGVYIYFKCDCINITTGNMCTYIDRNRIEIASWCITLYFLGLYQCCHEAYVYKYWLIRHWSPSFFHRFPISVVTVKNCHCALIIDTTVIELFERAPYDYDFHLYNRSEHDTRQQKLSISIRSFAPEKYGIATFHG